MDVFVAADIPAHRVARELVQRRGPHLSMLAPGAQRSALWRRPGRARPRLGASCARGSKSRTKSAHAASMAARGLGADRSALFLRLRLVRLARSRWIVGPRRERRQRWLVERQLWIAERHRRLRRHHGRGGQRWAARRALPIRSRTGPPAPRPITASTKRSSRQRPTSPRKLAPIACW
jgi:hypothetical protein